MIELMIFIWVIGWMFTSGAAIEKDTAKTSTVLLAVIIWPVFLGISWQKKK